MKMTIKNIAIASTAILLGFCLSIISGNLLSKEDANTK